MVLAAGGMTAGGMTAGCTSIDTRIGVPVFRSKCSGLRLRLPPPATGGMTAGGGTSIDTRIGAAIRVDQFSGPVLGKPI